MLHAARLPALLALLAVSAFSGGCAVDREPNYEWLPWLNQMMFSRAAESQAKSPLRPDGKPVFANGRVMQNPPMGTIPRGFTPLHFTADDAGRAEAAQMKSSLDPTPENLARGQAVFATFCTPCHGQMGAGDGPVSKRGMPGFALDDPNGPPGKMTDGEIFHIVTYGRGVMPSYASQIPAVDRWKVIQHVRFLQQLPKDDPNAEPHADHGH